MGTKLCFNCYAKVDETELSCSSCGVSFYDEQIEAEKHAKGQILRPDKSFYAPAPDYEQERENLEKLEKGLDVSEELAEKRRLRDLFWISLLTSLLGILQIFTAGLMQSINEVGIVFFGINQTIDGIYLLISGFIYFIGIVAFYLRFSLTRKIFLVANVIHLVILYRVYSALWLFAELASYDTMYFPSEIVEFLDNVTLFISIMVVFGLLYVLHIFYMFKDELVKIRAGRS